MEMRETGRALDAALAEVVRNAPILEKGDAHGHWDVVCYGPDGREKWRDSIENVVCTEGKNQMMDAALAGSSYTVTGPFVGLISSVSYTAVAATDVGTQINGTNGWKEAGGGNAPTYSGNRPTAAWSAASANSKAFSAPAVFNLTGSGTVKGMFLLYGSAATHTIDDAHGLLWSAGLFSQGDKIVGSGDILNASYSTSL